MAAPHITPKPFNFFIPLDFEKGKDSAGKDVMKVKGVASTVDRDADEQILEPVGFDLTSLLQKGFINYNHQAKHNPKAIIGQPTSAKLIDNGTKLYLEGFLYPNSPLAKDVFEQIEIMHRDSPDRQMGWSIEGVPTEFHPVDKSRITKAQITGVAITASPKNDRTFVEIMKSYDAETSEEDEKLEDKEESEEKAITTGIGLEVESVEGGEKKYMNKSEIFDEIVIRCPGNELTVYEKLFNFTENYFTKNNMKFSKANIDSILGKVEEELEKSIQHEPISETATETESVVVETPVAELPLEKSTTDTVIEKGDVSDIVGAAKGMYVSGMSVTSLTEGLIRGGFSLEPSSTTAEQVVAEMSALDANGGDITAASPEDPSEALISKALEDNVFPALGRITTVLEKLSTQVGNLVTQNQTNKQELEKANTEISTLSETLKGVNAQYVPPRSINQAIPGALPRFEKGNEGAVLDANSYNIATPKGRNDFMDRLLAEYKVSSDNNRPDATIEKALNEFEITGKLSPSYIPYLQAKNIKVFAS